MSGENESILEQLASAKAKVRELHTQLSATGKPQKPFTPSDDGGVLVELHETRREAQRCESLLGKPATPAPTPAQPTTPPVVIPPSAQTQLTDDEIATLCLTDRIRYNQGTLSTERARVKLATLSHRELCLLGWTDRIRYAQGKLSATDARLLILGMKPSKKPTEQSLSEQCRAGSTEVTDRAAGRK